MIAQVRIKILIKLSQAHDENYFSWLCYGLLDWVEQMLKDLQRWDQNQEQKCHREANAQWTSMFKKQWD